ncbi:5'-nucleotidase C-terminal domain-containing protein [Prevotella loescheii]|nr:5'-nucleotidase C-terminal domain-containing protein [Hoylesella loescheii]
MKHSLLTIILILLTATSTATRREVHILSMNDMHAAFDRFPQFATLADSLRQLYPDILILSAGDNRTGNPYNDLAAVPSRPMVELMNKTGFSYTALGNHEFDGGIDRLRETINNSWFKYLCANIIAPDSMRLHIEPFTLTECGGTSIAILGLTQRDSISLQPDTSPTNVRNISFAPYSETARRYAWLRNVCDVFILLTHIGVEDDVRLAREMPEADIIIGGHSHTKLDPCIMEGNVMITQAERLMKYATHITLTVDNGKVVERKAELLDIAKRTKRDIQMTKAVEEFCDIPAMKRVLTNVEKDITEKEEVGCIMADALREEAKADIAITNAGGVRLTQIDHGPLTVNDVYRTDPFGNKAVTYTMTGKEIERLLIETCKSDGYGPAYVSGMTYSITLGRDNTDVRNISLRDGNGKKMDMRRTYTVAVNSYMAETVSLLKDMEGTYSYDTTAEMLTSWLERKPSIDYAGTRRVSITQGGKARQ